MKEYLVSVYNPEPLDFPKEEMDAMGADVDALNADMRKAGVWLFAGGLFPSSTATTLQVKNGEVITTDGPYAEGKEHIGGFWVIRVKDLDEALKWGARATQACRVPIEVRPFEGAQED